MTGIPQAATDTDPAFAAYCSGLDLDATDPYAEYGITDMAEAFAAGRAAERQRLQVPELVIRMKGDDLTPEQIEQLKAQFREAQRTGRLHLVPDAFKPVAEFIAEAVAAERQRIRQLAIDTDAVCWPAEGDENGGEVNRPFTSLLDDPAESVGADAQSGEQP